MQPNLRSGGVMRVYTLEDAREFVAKFGKNPRIHPNGFIQLDIADVEEGWDESKKRGHSGADRRLHVWNPPGFEVPHQETVNEVHDHVFDMRSTVVKGSLIQKLYEFIPWNELERDAPPASHEIYKAIYDKKSSSRLEGPLEDGLLRVRDHFLVSAGQQYTQPAFTLHDTEAAMHTTVTIMEKMEIHEGDASVVCPIDQPPDNDFDRAKAAPADEIMAAINRSLHDAA